MTAKYEWHRMLRKGIDEQRREAQCNGTSRDSKAKKIRGKGKHS